MFAVAGVPLGFCVFFRGVLVCHIGNHNMLLISARYLSRKLYQVFIRQYCMILERFSNYSRSYGEQV